MTLEQSLIADIASKVLTIARAHHVDKAVIEFYYENQVHLSYSLSQAIQWEVEFAAGLKEVNISLFPSKDAVEELEEDMYSAGLVHRPDTRLSLQLQDYSKGEKTRVLSLTYEWNVARDHASERKMTLEDGLQGKFLSWAYQTGESNPHCPLFEYARALMLFYQGQEGYRYVDFEWVLSDGPDYMSIPIFDDVEEWPNEETLYIMEEYPFGEHLCVVIHVDEDSPAAAQVGKKRETIIKRIQVVLPFGEQQIIDVFLHQGKTSKHRFGLCSRS